MADEARLNEILDLYEQAKAEGDTALAERARAAWQLESGQTQAVATPPAAGPDMADPRNWPKGPGGQPVNPDSPLGQQLLAGQMPHAGTAINDPRVMAAGATRAVSGIPQLGAAIAATAGQEGAVEAVNARIDAFEKWVAGKTEFTEEEKKLLEASGFVGSTLLPVGRGAKGLQKVVEEGAKWGKTVVKGGALGGAAAAANYDPGAAEAWDKYLQTAFGVGAGATMSAAIAAYPGVKNFVVRIMKQAPTEENKKALAIIAQSPAFQAELEKTTIGMRSGRAEQIVQEGRVTGTRATEENNATLEMVRNKMLAPFKKGTEEASKIGGRIQEAISAERAKMQSRASTAYEKGIEAAKTVAREDVAYNTGMALDETSKAVAETLTTGSKWYDNIMEPGVKKYAQQIDETMSTLNASVGGRLAMDDVISLHQAATRMRAGLDDLSRGKKVSDVDLSAIRIGKKIVDAIERDVIKMDRVLQSASAKGWTAATGGASAPGEKFKEAWDIFKETRKNYRTHIAQTRDLDRSVVNQAFGQDAQDAAGMIRVLSRSELPEQHRLINILKNNDPAALEEVKSWVINDWGSRALVRSKAATLSKVDTVKAIEELANREDEIAGELLFSDSERKHLKAGIEYMRLINNKSSIEARPAEFKRLGMAAASRAIAFVSGGLYDLLATKKLEKLFFTEEGRRALQTFAKLPPGTPEFQKAMGWLAAETVRED